MTAGNSKLHIKLPWRKTIRKKLKSYKVINVLVIGKIIAKNKLKDVVFLVNKHLMNWVNVITKKAKQANTDTMISQPQGPVISSMKDCQGFILFPLSFLSF